MPDARLPIGEGGYELLHRIARGGMADVYLARRHGLGGVEQTVVVKRLRADLLGEPTLVRMFLWEAWICARLAHPNIARFVDLVKHRGRYHLVLEHVTGSNVSSIARCLAAAGEAFPLAAVVEIGIGVARALEHAHGLVDDAGVPVGLIHRDISPQNIVVSTGGDVVLLDFGVAKTTSVDIPRPTTKGLLKGKMAYIAPEQLHGEPMDGRSDLFSLGVVLHELLVGRRLFHRASDPDTLRAVLAGGVPRVGALRPACPSALEAIVLRALAQSPADRFGSAGEMLAALTAVRASLGEEPEAPSLAELARRARPASKRQAPPARSRAPAFPKPVRRANTDAVTVAEGARRRLPPPLRAWPRRSRIAALAMAFLVGAVITAAATRGGRTGQVDASAPGDRR